VHTSITRYTNIVIFFFHNINYNIFENIFGLIVLKSTWKRFFYIFQIIFTCLCYGDVYWKEKRTSYGRILDFQKSISQPYNTICQIQICIIRIFYLITRVDSTIGIQFVQFVEIVQQKKLTGSKSRWLHDRLRGSGSSTNNFSESLNVTVTKIIKTRACKRYNNAMFYLTKNGWNVLT